MAESFGVEDRGHFYDPVGALRDVVVNHLMQVVAAAAMEAPAGARPRRRSRTRCSPPSARCRAADPAHYVRGQYDGYRDIDGVAAGSTTETYAALRLEIDNWRWSGVPFFIRTGKLPAGHADRAAARLQAPAAARLRRAAIAPAASRTSSSIKLDPTTGVRLRARRRSAPTRRRPEPITLDMEFADEGGEGATPYEVLLHAAMLGRQRRASPARTASRRRGGSCSRCSTRRRRSTRTRRARGGRPRPTGSSRATAWHAPVGGGR